MASMLGLSQRATLFGSPVVEYNPMKDAYRNQAGQWADARTLREAQLYNSRYTFELWADESGPPTVRRGSSEPRANTTEVTVRGTFRDPKQEGKLMDAFKNYLSKNSGVIFTVMFVVLVDHFVFNGTFREKIKSLVDGFLNKAAKQVEEGA